MPISQNIIETPEVVWATPDETLEQLRDRLSSPQIRNKWRANVLVRSKDRHYAAISVMELRPIVWEQGPPVLKRRLQDLGLLHFQLGVEQDVLTLEQAEELASRHGGWLVVLQEGRYVGLVRSGNQLPAPGLCPKQAFDLFDEPLPDSWPPETDFVLANLNTTVAKIAKDLRFKNDPESAYIVVQMDCGSYRVITSRDLNDHVQQADGDLWAMPLRRFEAHLAQAAHRKVGTLGLGQAQSLADDEGFLVLTDGGRPVGLLASQLVRRGTSPSAARSFGASIYDLFNVPYELISRYLDTAGPKEESRFVNIWFEDFKQQAIARSQPLVIGRKYNLALNVGQLRENSLIEWNRTPGGPRAIVEPQEKEALLYVSLFTEDFDIPEPTRSLRLPREGDTDLIRFEVLPLYPSRGAGQSKIEVCLYYRTYLVQTFEVHAGVVTSDGEVAGAGSASAGQVQFAEMTHARTASFPEMETLPPRELSVTITRDGADRYRFTFLVDPDLEDEAAAARAVELSSYARLTRQDLTHLITKARRQLYNVVRSFDLLQDPDARTCRRATQALARVGRQLHLKLFESGSARALKDWMETSLSEGSTIQIVDLAGDFVFPWSLLYTVSPWDNGGSADVEKFWGWRYRLAILTDDLLDTYRQASTEIATDEPLRMGVGLYERLVGSAEQRAFLASLKGQSRQRIQPEILTSRRSMIRSLAAADRDFYYFFCHGYTERIATDIQLDADLLSCFARLVANAPDHESESLREHLDDLFDVSDSWMRLTRGKIPLTMLKEKVPDQFSQRPLVFLNMCESAQVLPSLSDGFVPFFIQRGARAVVGTECSMNTLFADDFARAFLSYFFQGKAVGEILLLLRRHYLDQGNPLALAYTLYGDADLRLGEPLLEEMQPIALEGERRLSEEQARWDAVELLWDDDMDGLMLTLAARLQAEEAGTAQAELQMWDPPEEAFAFDLEASTEWTAKMVDFGERWWAKLEPELYDLLCNRDNQDHNELMDALLLGARMLAVALAPALVAHVSALPAVAIVVATIAAQMIAETGLEAACEIWTESMLERDPEEPDQEELGPWVDPGNPLLEP